ncbi:signal transduction histidine kinase [Thermonema lapsum]|uniref:histidine kinase n=1 Tax=Thermonema lapsum TaxID=28195 RepID=A0A846MT84_9BACT|nr:sensor histidine kinase [Thermonema lapsum]NIK74665.1 signal transduction histidine kinase [Thermonema lapsum]
MWSVIKRWSVRYKLFASYAFFIALLGGLMAISLSFYNKRRSISLLSQQMTNVMIQTLQLVKIEQSFFLTDLKKSYFYRYGRSELIDKHKQLYTHIQQTIDTLLKAPLVQGSDIQLHLKDAREQLSIYRDKLNQTVVIVQRMGYNNYGEYGEVMRLAKAIEQVSGLPRAEWMEVRLMEQKAMKSMDSANQEELKAALERFRRLAHRRLPAAALRELEQLLAEYESHLRWYFIYYRQIGEEQEGEGLRFELRRSADRAIYALERALGEVAAQDSRLQGQFQNIMIVSFLIMLILSLTFGYFLSYLMTIPLQHLTRVMRRYTSYITEGQYDRIHSFYAVQKFTEDELGELTESFNRLLFSLQEALNNLEAKQEELEEANATLADINRQLEASNKALEDRNKKLHQISLEVSQKAEENALQRKLIEHELRIKEKIYTVISQEIRAPLSTLKGFLILLTSHENMLDAEEKKDLWQRMLGELEKVLLHLQDILQWMQQQSTAALDSSICFDLVRHIRDSVEQSRPFIEAKQLSLHFQDTCKRVVAAKIEKDVLSFVIRNLLSNAIRMTPPQGSVRINIECPEDNHLKVCIQDNGVGFSEAEMKAYQEGVQKISYQEKSKFNTAVLNLLMCYDFITKSGGSFSVESTPERGTKVCFTLLLVNYGMNVTQADKQH